MEGKKMAERAQRALAAFQEQRRVDPESGLYGADIPVVLILGEGLEQEVPWDRAPKKIRLVDLSGFEKLNIQRRDTCCVEIGLVGGHAVAAFSGPMNLGCPPHGRDIADMARLRLRFASLVGGLGAVILVKGVESLKEHIHPGRIEVVSRLLGAFTPYASLDVDERHAPERLESRRLQWRARVAVACAERRDASEGVVCGHRTFLEGSASERRAEVAHFESYGAHVLATNILPDMEALEAIAPKGVGVVAIGFVMSAVWQRPFMRDLHAREVKIGRVLMKLIMHEVVREVAALPRP